MTAKAGPQAPRIPRGKQRLDRRLVELGLARSAAQAEARIRAGEVRVDGRVVDKPGTLVAADALPEVAVARAYASRGGDKLAGALDALGLDPRGARCLDAGASSGGFSDCLLQRGAASVIAVDVGYGQLDPRLRADPRVQVHERTNVRHFELPPVEAPVDLLVADLSFIALRTVLARLVSLVRPGGRLLLLVKPQFELERDEVPPGGVVRDPALRDAAVARVAEAARALGLAVAGDAPSALAGPRGNRERFLLLERPA